MRFATIRALRDGKDLKCDLSGAVFSPLVDGEKTAYGEFINARSLLKWRLTRRTKWEHEPANLGGNL